MATRAVADCAVGAFLEGKSKKCGTHDKVEVLANGAVTYELFGNGIATRSGKRVHISSAGHQTATTKDRLNTILRRCGQPEIRQKEGVWWRGGEKWVGGTGFDCDAAATLKAPEKEEATSWKKGIGASDPKKKDATTGDCIQSFFDAKPKKCGSKDQVVLRGPGQAAYLVLDSFAGETLVAESNPKKTHGTQDVVAPTGPNMNDFALLRLNQIIKACDLKYKFLKKDGKLWVHHEGASGPSVWEMSETHLTCPKARVKAKKVPTTPTSESEKRNIRLATEALLAGEPFKEGDERIEVWQHPGGGAKHSVISYYMRTGPAGAGLKIADRYSDETKIDIYGEPDHPGALVRQASIWERCEQSGHLEEFGNEVRGVTCPGARKFTVTTATTTKPSLFSEKKPEAGTEMSAAAKAFVSGANYKGAAVLVGRPTGDKSVIQYFATDGAAANQDNKIATRTMAQRQGKNVNMKVSPPLKLDSVVGGRTIRQHLNEILNECGTGARVVTDTFEGWIHYDCPRGSKLGASSLTGPAKFGLPASANPTDDWSGKVCRVCGETWGAHRVWDCPTRDTERTNKEMTGTRPSPPTAIHKEQKVMPANCIVRAVPAGTIATLMEEGQRFSGGYIHAQSPSAVAVVKSFFRNKPQVEKFTGFLVKVTNQVRDYSDTRAYSGRPVPSQKVYKVVQECGGPALRQQRLVV